MAALCASLNCDYTYVDTDAEISGQTLEGSVLTITGVNLPTGEDVVIDFGPARCIPDSLTASEYVCQLEHEAVTGEWIVQVNTDDGYLPNTIADSILIPATVTSVYPNDAINFLGGDILEITGEDFGYDASAVSVTFADGTVCTVLDVQMTFINCELNRFTKDAASYQPATVSINGIQDSSLFLNLASAVKSTLNMSPVTASPVLKTELTIFLAEDYATALNRTDFKAVLHSATNTTYKKELYVVSVDQDQKSIKLKFNGAPSGDYFIMLKSQQHGRINSDLLLLKVHSTITSVTPQMGSLYGGTLVTIKGENFSNEPLDNPVKIGSHYCYVITSTPSEITCRTDYLLDQESGDQLLLVFLKTSEEAASE
jgi:hypothetical protein